MTVGDLGPEGLVFVPAAQSPNSRNLVIAANEVSGTVSIFVYDDQPLSAGDVSDAQPRGFALKQNYPNPFNPSTTIAYTLANAEQVSLKVYDVLGREVATLVNSKQSAGNYRLPFNASRLASGVYFYRLTAGAQSTVKKMMLLK
ncbi:MAG: T9SS type A sorting domain-containing protein [Rhizobacter sp.]|nr:T9SS type A sorting domain-containing protein [Chlorobiales bacterium]